LQNKVSPVAVRINVISPYMRIGWRGGIILLLRVQKKVTGQRFLEEGAKEAYLPLTKPEKLF